MPLWQTEGPLPWYGKGGLGPGGVWMFDSDHEGRRNLYFQDEKGRVRPFFGNSPDADDAYATYDFRENILYFCSNRSGRYRIYRYHNKNGGRNFSSWLGDSACRNKIEPVAELNAAGDTMAPFVAGDSLFFASNRSGGVGGFDLYLACRSDGHWQKPRNLQEVMPDGVVINTSKNEFRPSVFTLGFRDYRDFTILLFSSDRDGGQGGYDLYLTALPRLK